jgi:hypothetical protein
MKRRIIIVGDSFTFGHGCSDRSYYYDEKTETFVGDVTHFYVPKPSDFCWASLLQQQHPEVEIVNLAKPGLCNQAIFRDILDFFKENPARPNDILMYHGTFPDRLEIALHDKPEVATSWVLGFDHNSQKHSTVQYNIAKKMYVTHLYNDSIGFNISMSTVLAAYGFAIGSGMKFMWSIPMYNEEEQGRLQGFNPQVIDKLIPQDINYCRINSIMTYDFSEQENFEFNSRCRASDWHVNDKGHSIYFTKEIIPAIQTLL